MERFITTETEEVNGPSLQIITKIFDETCNPKHLVATAKKWLNCIEVVTPTGTVLGTYPASVNYGEVLGFFTKQFKHKLL